MVGEVRRGLCARGNDDPEDRLRDAFRRRDASAVRHLLSRHPGFRERIDEPLFAFNAPAIVAYANDAAIVDVLLECGADPSRRVAVGASGARLFSIAATNDRNGTLVSPW